MRIKRPFSNIQVGEVDTFAFDFSYDIGDTIIVTGTFTCSLAPYQKINDPNPQNHVLSQSIGTVIAIRVPPAAKLVKRPGNYVMATLGNFGSNSAGGVYVLNATANLSDGRSIQLDSTVLCVAVGD